MQINIAIKFQRDCFLLDYIGIQRNDKADSAAKSAY